MVLLIILLILATFTAGAAKGVSDSLQFHYAASRYKSWGSELFWNPAISWKNKYLNWDEGDKSEKFKFSTTWLVTFTDAWHSFQFLQNICIAISVALAVWLGTQLPPLNNESFGQYATWYYGAATTIAARGVFQIGFKLFYD